nr:retrovirus-related Pol polyprotein from transposon TNT 1-94 [Tanacetum cinerariifolium]
MRPFGCHVTILNIVDSLGKFEGKVDEGFLVGYSNYDGDDAFDGKEHDFNAKKPQSESVFLQAVVLSQGNKMTRPRKRLKERVFATGLLNAAASPTYGKYSFIDASKLPDDLNMPNLEDITYSDNDNDVGAEADFNNLETSIIVSPIPTIRVHKDHPVSQIIDDLSSTTQTKNEEVEELRRHLQIVPNEDDDVYTKATPLARKVHVVDYQVQPPSPQHQHPPQPQQAADFPMSLLQEAIDACATLTRRVEHLEYDKVAQALEITKLKRRVKKLEKKNKVLVLKLRSVIIPTAEPQVPAATLTVAPARITAAPSRRRK